VDQVLAYGMSPIHETGVPGDAERKSLPEQMVLTLVEDWAVYVIAPTSLHGEVELRTIALFVEGVRTFDLVSLINTVQSGLRGRAQKCDGLSFEFADIDKDPVVRGMLCQLHGEFPLLNPVDLDLKHVHFTCTCHRNIQIVFRDVHGSALREKRGGKQQKSE
jgi:hypothetical protein